MTQLYGFESAAFRAAQEVAKKYRDELRKKPGVIAVRAGYRIVNQWVTTTPAIVVSVDRKKLPSDLPEKDKIPSQLDGIPTDVTTASAKEIQAAKRNGAGDSLATNVSDVLEDVRIDENADLATFSGDAFHKTKYKKLSNDKNRPRRFPNENNKEDVNVLCPPGPDAGWAVSSQFLG